MSTLELKKLLISKIDDTSDEELLSAMYKLLDYNSSAGQMYMLTQEQQKAVQEAREQIRKGEITTNEELQHEIDRWLDA